MNVSPNRRSTTGTKSVHRPCITVGRSRNKHWRMDAGLRSRHGFMEASKVYNHLPRTLTSSLHRTRVRPQALRKTHQHLQTMQALQPSPKQTNLQRKHQARSLLAQTRIRTATSPAVKPRPITKIPSLIAPVVTPSVPSLPNPHSAPSTPSQQLPTSVPQI